MRDSSEQLLTVVSVVIMEDIGVEDELDEDDCELDTVAVLGVFEELFVLLPPFEMVTWRFVIVLEV